MLRYSNFIKLFETNKQLDILNESGGYGHLLHPYEDMTLTFADIKIMITEFVTGSFSESNFIATKNRWSKFIIFFY